MSPMIFAAKSSSLSPAQITLIEQVAAEWKASLTGVTPLDPTAMEDLVGDAYLGVGLTRPAVVLTVPSPFVALIANLVLKENLARITGSACVPLDPARLHPVANSFTDYLYGPPGIQQQAYNWSREALSRNLDDVAFSSICHRVAATDYPTYAGIYSGLVHQINHQTGKSLNPLPTISSFARFLREGSKPYSRVHSVGTYRSRSSGHYFFDTLMRLGLNPHPLAGALDDMELARAAGGWWLFNHAALVVQKPVALTVDGSTFWGEAPHSIIGPAASWYDGFEAFAIFGHTVAPGAVSSPAALTAAIVALRDMGKRCKREVLAELGLTP